jgi:dTDP-4-dehydrorhamnose reductase
MRLLLTGSHGLLGSAIRQEFRDDEVTALDHAALDITDDNAVRSTISNVQPDAVVNCVAFNGVDAAEDDPVTALTVNAFAVKTLARASAATGAVFVHYSSDFVFDGETDRPYSEEDRPNPRSVYGASKLLGEWFALVAPTAYVLRVESLFGPSGANSTRRGSLATIADRIAAGEEVAVFTDRTVSPAYTPDVADATAHLLRTRAPFGLYHCVNSGHATWIDVAQHVAQVLDKPLRAKPVTLATVSLRARRPQYCAMSNAKLVAAGFRMRSWQDGVVRFLSQ